MPSPGPRPGRAIAAAAYDGRDWSGYLDAARYVRGVLRWRRGDVPAALADLDRAAEHIAALDMPTLLVHVLVDAAEVAAGAGADDWSRRLSTLLAELRPARGAELHAALESIAAAWAAVDSGDTRAVTERATEAPGILEAFDLPFWTGRAHDVLGRAHGVCDPHAAVGDYRLAADAYDRCGAVAAT